MSGVWVFKNGVMRLNDGGGGGGGGASSSENQSSVKKKVLVYLPTGDVVSSYSCLENILTQELGWERYYGDTELLQFHKTTSIDLISLPKDFSKFTSVYMYDIVVKNPNVFRVRES